MMEDREQKVASVLKRINDLIEAPVQPKSGDEWPTLTREQVTGFRELVHDLANLAFEPDWKERNVLAIQITEKKKVTVHTFYEMRDFEIYGETDDATFFAGCSDLLSTANHMIGVGNSLLERVANAQRERAYTFKKEVEAKNDFDGLRALLDADDLTGFRAEADRLMDKYDPPLYAGGDKTPYNRSGSYRKLPDELQELINQYGTKLPTETVQPALDAIAAALDAAQPLIGVGRGTEYEGSGDDLLEQARDLLLAHKYQIGQRALQPVLVRYNRMYDEHKVLKRLATQGKKVVEA